jgi:hypothetical protein
MLSICCSSQPSSLRDRVVDVAEELLKFGLLLRPHSAYLVDRCIGVVLIPLNMHGIIFGYSSRVIASGKCEGPRGWTRSSSARAQHLCVHTAHCSTVRYSPCNVFLPMP